MSKITKHNRRFTIWCALALIANFVNAAETDSPSIARQSQGISVVAEPKPTFPESLLRQGISTGLATVSINVDDNGNLVDWLVVEASDQELAAAIDDVIMQWSFSPSIINGQPVVAVQLFPISFDASSNLKERRKQDRNEFTDKYYSDTPSRPYKKSRNPLKFAFIEDLDSIPVAIHRAAPNISDELYKISLGSEVVFEFYIDTNGYVRMPTLASVSGNISPEAIVASQEALEQWRFKPLTSKKKLAITKIAQPFRYSYLYATSE